VHSVFLLLELLKTDYIRDYLHW